jgi:hypothetical protein
MSNRNFNYKSWSENKYTADNFITAPPTLTAIISEKSVAKRLSPLLELKQNICSQKFKDGCEVETVVT